MRTLKYAILGLIHREPMTGYDITREFNNNNLANFWYAKHSQVYPELAKLTEEGLLTSEIVIQGEKLEKKLYTITPKGIEEFQEWLMHDDPLPPTPKDIFRLRLYFSDSMSKEQFTAHVHKDLTKHVTKQQYLNDVMQSNYSQEIPAFGSREFGDYIVLEGAILREASYIQWLENCLARIEENNSEPE